MARFKNKIHLVWIPIIGLLVVFFSFKSIDFKTSKSLDIFFSFFRELSIFYVDDIDPEKLIYTGIDAMLNSLDPYNDFIPEENKETFEFQTTGEYGGMGALIRHGVEFAIIAEVYEGSPAHKAGLMAGDEIRRIDGVSTKELPVDKVSSMLKGPSNTMLKLIVKRYGVKDSLEFNFNREKIHIPSVPYYGMVNNDLGYIRLSNFTANCESEVKEALKSLKKQKAKGLILDLRSNPGGLLYEAVKIVNLFVEKDQLVVYTKGQIKEFDQEYKTPSKPFDIEIPLVVIVDRISASASEIVAGALQDLDRAIIIGERTFGKGLVQATRPLPHNAQLKITTAKYYIPSGRCIQAVDFAKRDEEGRIHSIPDSLISKFETKNGRAVYDGGGIAPDIEQSVTFFSRLSASLYAQNMLFNFATQFRNTHSNIAPPAKFELTEDDFSGFISFLDSVGFEYESQTSILLKELKESAKTENYYTASQSLFDSLEVAIERKGFAEFDLYKEEIAKLIEEEIVGRYYLQKGKAEYSLNKDEVIEKCIEVLTNPNLSTQVLSGNNKKVTHSLKSQTTRVKGTESKYVDKLTAQKGIKRMPS
ncbi:MAG: S41 family peptidase [Bacteroidales bacterium]|nr:S41 family peptidase [Bacteroidales bacterium]MDD4384690.1 S41 family peptidase [Bacteroidales bacterium]